MRKYCRYRWGASVLALGVLTSAVGVRADVQLEHLWTHEGGGAARAEIVAYDELVQQLLVVDGEERRVVRLDLRTGRELGKLDVSRWGNPTSVAASRGLIAVAVVAEKSTDPGHAVLFRSAAARPTGGNARPVAVRVGPMPDMVTFTPDGRYVLTANEGEPSDDYRTDPEGSVSVIDVGDGAEQATVRTADFAIFNSQRDALEQHGARISGPNAREADGRATVAQDVEPEYVAAAPDGRTAWVALQENNALAEIDVATAMVTRIIGLGLKDHLRRGQGLDASDRDGGNHVRRWPVWGMYQPDGLAAFDAGGRTYIVSANEGDGREYDGFEDEARVADTKLDHALLGRNPELQNADKLGRLKVSRVGGDLDGDGDLDRLLAFGARSIAIWNERGELVYDSGDALERFIAQHLPERFNIDEDGLGTVDSRSPAKGPEPEGVVVGRVGPSIYAFAGLERTSAVAIFDVTRPAEAKLLDVVPLDFDPGASAGRNIAPEGLAFIPADKNPLGDPLLAVACEVTGTTILFRVLETR